MIFPLQCNFTLVKLVYIVVLCFAVNSDVVVVEKNGVPSSLSQETDSTETTCEITETIPEPAEVPVISETPVPVVQQEEVKKPKEEKGSRFGKLFKKKAPPQAEAKTEEKQEKSGEDQADASPPAPDPESVSIDFSTSRERFVVSIVGRQPDYCLFLKVMDKKGWLGFLIWINLQLNDLSVFT